MHIRASVILVTWNSFAYLAKCLDCLVVQTNKDFEVLIIDNGSTNNDFLEIEGKYSGLNLSVKRLEQNTGGTFIKRSGSGVI